MKRFPHFKALILAFIVSFQCFGTVDPMLIAPPQLPTGIPAIQNQPVVIPSYENVEMERIRIFEETGKAEKDEIDFQKQIVTLQKKLAEASSSSIIPESLPTDYRSFLSTNAGDIKKSEEYYSELKFVLNELVPESPYRARTVNDTSNYVSASEKLVKLSSYPADDDICRSIRGHISALSGGRVDDQRRLNEINGELKQLFEERKRLEWNLKMTQNVNPLTGRANGSEDQRAFIRQQIEDVKESTTRLENEKNSLSHLVTSEVRKLQFQQFIVELAIQQRYIHALIACGFYRSSFKGGDLGLSEKAYPSKYNDSIAGSNTSKSEFPTTGGAPTSLPTISTITGMEAFLLNRIRDAVKERESIDNMLQENQIAAAETLVRKMVLTAKYQPELQTLPYASRQKILHGGQSMRRLADAVNAHDYEEIKRLVEELESNGADTGLADLKAFATEHPRKAMHWARQAELAAKIGDLKSMNSLMEIAIRRAPLDSAIAKKIESIQISAASDQGLAEELKRVVSTGDYRSAFDRMNEFVPLAKRDTSDPALRAKYEVLLEMEKKLRSSMEKTDSLERRGSNSEAWLELEALPPKIANDPRILERKGRLAGRCPKFVDAYNKAVENENANRNAKALTWYLNALSESPGNEIITNKIHSIGANLLEN